MSNTELKARDFPGYLYEITGFMRVFRNRKQAQNFVDVKNRNFSRNLYEYYEFPVSSESRGNCWGVLRQEKQETRIDNERLFELMQEYEKRKGCYDQSYWGV